MSRLQGKSAYFIMPVVSLLTSGCVFGERNVYPLTPDEAYSKLVGAHIAPSGSGPFGQLETSVSGDGSSTVRWYATGAHATIECEANLVAEGTDKTRIMAHCGGNSPSSGAASGMVMAMNRNALIEHIDATLRGRAYEPRLAQGSTAAGWPKDSRQPDASYGAAVGEALQMERDMKRMQRDFEQQQAEVQAEAAERLEDARAAGDTSFEPDLPMETSN